MSYINHPLLTAHVNTAAPATLTGTVGLVCQTVTSGAQTISIDLSSISPATGDFIILCVWGSHSSPTTYSKFRTKSGWWKLGPEGVGYKYTSPCRTPKTTFCKFWDTGTDTNSFTITAYPNGASETMCWTAWKFDGISKIQPVDFPAAHCYDSISEPVQLVWTPQMYGHGTRPTSVILVQGNQMDVAAPTETGAPFDWSSPDNYYAADGTDIISYQWHSGTYYQHVFLIAEQPKTEVQNLLANAEFPYGDGNTTVGGLTTVRTAQRNGTTSTNVYFPEIQIEGNRGVTSHYVEGAVTLSGGANNKFIVRARLAAQQGVTGSSTELWGVTASNPAGTEVGGAVYGRNIYSITDRAYSFPEEYQLNGRQYSGIPSEYAQEVVYVIDATDAGSYAFRGYLLNSSEAIDFDAGGGAGTWVQKQHVFSGLALGENAFPEYIPTGAGGQATGSSGNYLAPICWTFKNSEWVSATWGLYFSGEDPLYEPVYAFTLARSGTTSWEPFRMVSMQSYVPQGQVGDDGVTAKSVYIDNITNSSDYEMKSNRWVLPSYYATEDAVSPTAGKYYCEITQTRTTTTTSPSISVYPCGIYMGEVSVFGTQVPPGAVNYIVTGGMRFGQSTGFSTLPAGTYATLQTAGDILGIALDYENQQVSFYVNGVLQHTQDLTAFNYDWATCPAQIISDTFPTTDAAQSVLFDFNFTGPFTYSKPTGFVAWDRLNEVA